MMVSSNLLKDFCTRPLNESPQKNNGTLIYSNYLSSYEIKGLLIARNFWVTFSLQLSSIRVLICSTWLVLLRKSRLEKKKRKTNFLWSFLSKPKKILSVNHWRYFHVYLREYLFVYDWGSPKGQIISKAISIFLTSSKKRTKKIWLVIS